MVTFSQCGFKIIKLTGSDIGTGLVQGKKKNATSLLLTTIFTLLQILITAGDCSNCIYKYMQMSDPFAYINKSHNSAIVFNYSFF